LAPTRARADIHGGGGRGGSPGHDADMEQHTLTGRSNKNLARFALRLLVAFGERRRVTRCAIAVLRESRVRCMNGR
jgi:hypothetical protein